MPYVKSAKEPNFHAAGDLASNPAHKAGIWLGDNVPKLLAPFHKATQDSKHIPGWLGGIGMGGLAGAGLGGLVGAFTGNTLKGALLGGGLGALGLSALGYVNRNPKWAESLGLKQPTGVRALKTHPYDNEAQEDELIEKYGMVKSAYGDTMGNPIIARIYRDNELTLTQKQELATQVGYLNAQDKRRLNQIIGGAFGGGVGMLVAKYLLGLGKFSTILTTIVSGLAGAMMSGGRAPKSPYDSRGRPYYM